MNTINHLLLNQIAEGDKKAFDIFFKHYYPKLIQFACIFVSSTQQAEDVVADVLTNMLIHRKRVFILEHFEAYLYSSVKNKALSSIKRQEKVNSYPQNLQNFRQMAAVSADPHELLVEQELHTLIREIIHNFPPKRKIVFQLIREDGLSYRQAADLMEISERTVEVHLKLAVKALRQRIEQYMDQKETKKAMLNLVKVLAPLLLSVLYS